MAEHNAIDPHYGNEQDLRDFAAAVLNFTLDGIPFLYNGQEFGDRTRTRWIERAPLDWQSRGIAADIQESKTTLERYRALVHARSSHPILYSGELIWVNNSEPDSVLSFVRKKGDEEVLVLLNLSNRKSHVYIDLRVMEYYSVENLLKNGKTWFELYSSRVWAHLGAFE